MASCVKCFRSKKECRSRCSVIENCGSRLYWVTSSGHTHGFVGGATASIDGLIVYLPFRKTCEPVFALARYGSAPSLELIDPPNRGQTNECRVRLFEGCDVPQREQSHANPTRLWPGPLNRDVGTYVLRIEEGQPGQQSVVPLLTRSTGLTDSQNSLAIRRETTGLAFGQWFADARDRLARVHLKWWSKVRREVCAPL